MKTSEKKLILVVIIVGIVIMLAINIFKGNKSENKQSADNNDEYVEEFVEVLENGTKLNTSTKLHESKYINGIKIENIELTYKNGQTILLADIINETDKKTEEKYCQAINASTI